MEKLVKQYLRDSGQVVRRRFSFPPAYTVSEAIVNPDDGLGGPNNVGGLFDTSPAVPWGQVVRRRETSVHRWFSGSFTYYAPAQMFADTLSGHAQVAKRMLGLDLTPDLLWELAPWSWAVDWFSSTGAAISNLSALASDGLVMRYGYIMEHTRVQDTYTLIGSTKFSSGYTGRPAPLVFISETKIRRRANPYGFGLTMAGLNGRQKSILAALGLSRLR